jgi:hypothetical protein
MTGTQVELDAAALTSGSQGSGEDPEDVGSQSYETV